MAPHPLQPNARILVVDDDEIVAAGLLAALRRDGYDVLVTHNGYAALDALSHEDFALVLTDLKMPGMSGIEVLQQVRRLQQRTPVVVMSGYANRQAADEALEWGADEFLVKPVDYVRLRDTLRMHIAQAVLPE